MDQLIAAIDQGTTSTRCILFDAAANPVASAQQEHRQIFPRPGWVEHDPREIWKATQAVVADALEAAHATTDRVAAVGIANQRETVVIWNRHTGRPYHHAIVWQDTRTKKLCEQLGADHGPSRFQKTTGLPLATYFSGPKIRWALDNDAALRKDAENGDAIAGTIDSYLIWQLTGGTKGGRHVTDVTNASRTLLMDLTTLDWDRNICEAIGVPPQMLPTIAPSIDRNAYGTTHADGPFGEGVTIGGALGDQQAALLGQCCFDPGDTKNTYGTGCFILLNTGKQAVASTCGLLTTVAYQQAGEKPRYALEGSIAVTGSLVQWLRDNLGLIEKSSDIEPLARSVPDTAGMYIVPAFSGLFAPHWRSDARGVFVGLTRMVNKAHIARAALEATCYQTREALDAMAQDTGKWPEELKVDGGMTVNDLLMQAQADILGLPVVRPKVSETTALGAAYAAGLAVGVWPDLDALRKNWQADHTWTPQISQAERAERFAGWQKAVERTLDWA